MAEARSDGSPGFSLGAVVRAALLASLASATVACASGGGGGGASPPVSPPISPPTSPPVSPPPPPPPPASFYETAEYSGSRFVNRTGLPTVSASSAYAAGATGKGIVVAVIDTNVDTTISELSGQLATGGLDVNATTRSASDIDSGGHGTLVTTTIVGKKNDAGVHGIAFDAAVLAIRADRPGSCQETGTDKGCSFRDGDVSRAIDYAISHGARVINLSLGGDVDNDSTLEDAVRRAAAAGVLVVASAGNEAEPATSTAAAKGLTPGEPAYIAGEAASLGRVVAAGSIDTNRKIAGFSNRAGATKNFYLLAPGVKLVTAGPDDNIIFPNQPTCSATITSGCNDTDSDGNYYASSGTSFSAPLVSGALALMLSLFPNITPENALKALLMTADDYVDPAPDAIRGEAAGVGADAVSGVGIMNLAKAFAPIGATSLNFGGAQVSLGVALAPASGALGDWAENSGAFDGLVFQDALERGFRIGHAELSVARAPITDLGSRDRYARGVSRAFAAGPASLSWSSPAKEPYDPRRPWAQAPEPSFELHYNFGQGGEIATGRGGAPASLSPSLSLVEDRSGPTHLDSGQSWTAVSQAFGPLTLDFRASTGAEHSTSGVGLGFGGDDWSSRLGFTSLKDAHQALGGALEARFGGADSTHLSAVSMEGAKLLGRWRLSGLAEAASVKLGDASANRADVSGLWTSSWSLSAERSVAGGVFRLSAAQPRRSEGGGLTFGAPIEVLKSGAIRYEDRTASLTPSGREFDLEAAWRTQLAPATSFEAAGAFIVQPNHIAAADPALAMWLSVRHAW